MVKNSRLIYFVGLVILFSCGNKDNSRADFYLRKKEENDVWRIPIIYPFRLITANCCRNWGLVPRQINANHLPVYSIDSINYKDSIILFFSPDSYIDWGVIDLKQIKFFKFERREMDSFCAAKSIERKLYDPEEIYQNWKESGILPWTEQMPK